MRLLPILLLTIGCDDPSKDIVDTAAPATDATDNDGDGYTAEEGDCEDGDPAISPDAAEVCDGVDNNCDAVIDENCTNCNDNDNDGFLVIIQYQSVRFGPNLVEMNPTSLPDLSKPLRTLNF